MADGKETPQQAQQRSIRKLSTTGQGLYFILQVPKGAPVEDVRKSYKKMALRFHPDKNPGNPQASEMFKEINRAHTILSDPTKRSIYDKYGSLGLYIGEQFGEENVNAYFVLSSPWCKGLILFCGVITGCYFCCCCCCCCNFCFGKYKPKQEEEYEYVNLKRPNMEDLNDSEGEGSPTHHAPAYGSDPITAQPGGVTESTNLRFGSNQSYGYGAGP